MKKSGKTFLFGILTLAMVLGCHSNQNTSSNANSQSSEIETSSDVRTSSQVPSSSFISSSESSAESKSSSSSSLSSSASSSSSQTTKTLESISLDTTNVKKQYTQGETLDLTGLVVTANYSDNSKVVVDNYQTNPQKGAQLNEIKDVKVTVTFETKTATFVVNVAKATKSNWTEAEQNLMKAHLYDNVLPYSGFEESVVSYVEEGDMITIAGGKVETNTLANYATKLSEAGYLPFEESIGHYYKVEKAVSTAQGERTIRVYVSTDENNAFYVEAYDPYLYQFPTSYFASTAKSTFASDVVIPAFPADYYELYTSEAVVYCFTESQTAEEDYSAILEAANWELKGFIYDLGNSGSYMAYSPDGRYAVVYSYYAPDHDLDIGLMPLDYWNNNLIDEFFAKYGDYKFSVPEFDCEEGYYIASEDPNNALYILNDAYEYLNLRMIVYNADVDDCAAYAQKISSLGWTVKGSDGMYDATIPFGTKGLARIAFDYSEKSQAVIVRVFWKLDPFPTDGFPSAQVAELLGEDITDFVPAYTGPNNGFQVITDSTGSLVLVAVDSGTENDCIASYISTLKQASYTEGTPDYFGDIRYVSPNNQIVVTVYKPYGGCFTITFARSPFRFPANEIANFLGKLITDKVPAIDTAIEYYYEINQGQMRVDAKYASVNAAQEAKTAYFSLLAQAQYTDGGLDYDGDVHFISPNGQFHVCPYLSNNELRILIVPGEFTPAPVGWPTDLIGEILTEIAGESLTDTLPAYEDGTTYLAYKTKKGNLQIDIVCADGAKGVEDYAEILKSALFVEAGEDTYGDMHYASPNGELDVVPWEYDTNEFIIDVVVTK